MIGMHPRFSKGFAMQKAKSKKFMFMEKTTIKPVWFDSLGAKSSHRTGVKGCIRQKEATFCHRVPLSHRLREGGAYIGSFKFYNTVS